MGIKGKISGVYRFLFLALHLIKCAFHVLSGGTICVEFVVISPFTVSNYSGYFFGVVSLMLGNFRQNLSFSGAVSIVLKLVSFVNLKAVENRAVKQVFLLANLRFEIEF